MSNQVDITYPVNGNYFENGYYSLDNQIEEIAVKHFAKWQGSGVGSDGERDLTYQFQSAIGAEKFIKEIAKFENIKIKLDGNEIMRVDTVWKV